VSVDCVDRTEAPHQLADGRLIAVREMGPDEEETVLQVFAGLGATSRERRFLTPKPRLSGRDLRQLAAVDGVDHVAMVAMFEDTPIGIARFVRDPADPQSADAAIAVVDGWQRQGVGTALVGALVQRGRDAGVHRFGVTILRDNDGVLRLLRRARIEVGLLGGDRDTAELALSLVAQPGAGQRSRP